MKKVFLFLSLILFFLSVQAQRPSYGGKLKPEQENMDIRFYDIHLKVNIPQKEIEGYTIIKCLLKKEAPIILLDLMDSLKVNGVLVNGKKVDFQHENNLLTLHKAVNFPSGIHMIKVLYSGHPMIAIRPPWDDGFTFTQDSSGHPWVAITAEGTGGKIFYPAKDHPSDEPDEGARLSITVPKDLVVPGPGILKSRKVKGDWVSYTWETHYPINNYSILFNIGDYVLVERTYTTILGNKVPMQFYVLREHQAQAAHLLELMEKAAHIKEKYLGEYPWAKEKIGLVETPHLGMEHQTMNAYGNKFRYTKKGGEDFDWLMNHEFGHEWWGNKVTAGDWADEWIHEGIETFCDHLYTLDTEGEESYENLFRQSVFQIKNDKPLVIGKDITEDEAYHPDIYPKGGFFMHTLRYVLGDSVFFPALKGFVTDPRFTYNHTTNTRDLMDYFNQRSGRNLDPLFQLYIYSIDKLEIEVIEKSSHQYSIRFKNLNMDLPLDIRTEKGISRILVNQKGVLIDSKIMPIIDEKGFYLKRLIYE